MGAREEAQPFKGTSMKRQIIVRHRMTGISLRGNKRGSDHEGTKHTKEEPEENEQAYSSLDFAIFVPSW
jgi:hypothetical protein